MRKLVCAAFFLVSLSAFASVLPPTPQGCASMQMQGLNPFNGMNSSGCDSLMMDPHAKMLTQMELLNQRGIMPRNNLGIYQNPIYRMTGQITPPQVCAMGGGASCMAPINQDPRFQPPRMVHNPISRYQVNPAAYSPMAPAGASFR